MCEFIGEIKMSIWEETSTTFAGDVCMLNFITLQRKFYWKSVSPEATTFIIIRKCITDAKGRYMCVYWSIVQSSKQSSLIERHRVLVIQKGR
jgi:hypothetical protein